MPEMNMAGLEGCKRSAADFLRDIIPRFRGKRSQRRNTEPVEREKAQCRPKDARTNTEGQPPQRCAEREPPTGILQNSPRPNEGRNTRPPERAVTFSARLDGLSEAQAQTQEPPPDPPSSNRPSPRTTRSSTWRSSGGASIRSAASTAVKKLLCIDPSLFRPEGQRGLQRSRSDPAPRRRKTRSFSWRKTKSFPWRQKNKCPDDAPPDEKRPPRDRAPPCDMSGDPESPDFGALRAYLRQREQTYNDFSTIWEEKALPTLRNAMVENSVSDYSITVQFDYGFGHRIVEVMTQTELPPQGVTEVRSDVSLLFVETGFKVDIQFTVGEVKRSSSAVPAPAPTDQEDPWDPPGNSSMHDVPLYQGDSVGCLEIKEECAATIGPAIRCSNGQTGCLVNYHLFEEATQLKEPHDERRPPPLHLVHPARSDCSNGEEPRTIAVLGACSGKMCQTQRPSRSLQLFARNEPTGSMRVVTDWAICFPEKDELSLKNRLRYAPAGREFQDFSGPIRGVYKDAPRLCLVRSSGRSSGIRWSTVCEVPAEVRHGSGPPTREWYLENIPQHLGGMLTTERWNSGGPGVPGDSGAAVIDDEHRRLIGQIWGRNVYSGDIRIARVTYFTHIYDIFDDIKARYPDLGYPTLVDQTDPLDLGPTVPMLFAPPGGNQGPALEPDADGTTLGSQRSAWRPSSSSTDEKGMMKSTSRETLHSASGSSVFNESLRKCATMLEKEIGVIDALKEPKCRIVMGR